MLVAVAIFMVLMSGIVMLFVGSLRAYRVSQQQMDAFEEARGALSILNTDLASAFEGGRTLRRRHVLRLPNRNDLHRSHPHQRRLLRHQHRPHYLRPLQPLLRQVRRQPPRRSLRARHRDPAIPTPAKNAPRINGPPATPTRSLRYVEPGCVRPRLVSPSIGSSAPSRAASRSIGYYIKDAIDTARENGLCDTCEDEFRRAKRREYWIRMLAGGGLNKNGYPLPNAWEFPERLMGFSPEAVAGLSPYAYIVTANVLSVADPDKRVEDFAAGTPLFDYDYSYIVGNVPAKIGNNWWNDYRSLNCDVRNDWRYLSEEDRIPGAHLRSVHRRRLHPLLREPPAARDRQRQFLAYV